MRAYKGDPTKLAGASPHLSTELLQFIEGCYALQIDNPVKLGGSWNLNVLTDGHVVRAYGPWVTIERLQELQRVRRILNAKGIPTPALRPASSGSFSALFNDAFDSYVVEVERYVDGTPMQTWTQLQVGMRELGRLHTLMADLESQIPPPVANHLPEELALAATQDVLDVIRAWRPTVQGRRLRRGGWRTCAAVACHAFANATGPR